MLRIFRHYISASSVFLFSWEHVLLLGIFYALIPVVLTHSPNFAYAPALFVTSLLLAVMTSALLGMLGTYDKWHLADYSHVAKRLIISFVFCFPLLLVVTYLQVGRGSIMSASLTLGCALVMSAGLGGVFASRLLYSHVAGLAGMRRRILVLGAGPRAANIERLARERRDHGFEIVGYVRAMNEQAEVDPSRVLSESESLNTVARRLGVQEIVVALTDRRGVPVEPLMDCRLDGITVTSYLTFWERESGKVMLEALDPSWLIYSDGFGVGTQVNAFLKRLFDIVVGGVFTVLVLPLMAVAALVIRLDSPGPILYTQERVGRNGRTFVLYKFRSMRVDAEKDGVPQWASLHDRRVTRVGNFIRKTRIDELPQVFNVLKGDMSFIGPRPERPFFVESLCRDIPYYRERCRVRPGITGWAQINYPYGASIDDAKEKLSYDFYYIKNYSVMLDFLVLLATVQVVFWSKGSR